MKLYNTLSDKKESLKKPANRTLKLFVCGPTVYDYSHIGHARTYIFFDSFVRWLRAAGFKIFYLQNITDIDDKIISRAKQIGASPSELAKKFEKAYHEDEKRIGITSVNKYARATDYIPQIVKQVQTLIKKGHAYKIEGDGYYFDLSTFPEYGKLAKRTKLQAEDAVSRIDEGVKKRNKGDFALWKFSKSEEPFWNTSLGKGRPGWHIEDTAISEYHFGPQYDLHGGAVDLKFPHHESEIAQQESASGKKPFVKIWIHTGFLLVKGEKMSKSLGNFITIRDFLKKFSPEVLRMIVLSRHYHSPLDYNEKLATDAENTVYAIKDFLAKLELIKKWKIENRKWKKNIKIQKYENDFKKSLSDDFNTPKALAVIFKLINNCQKNIWQISPKNAVEIADFIVKNLGALGFYFKKEKIPLKIAVLAKKREKLRTFKQFIQGDRLRKIIQKLGYSIEDTPYGPQIAATRLRS